MKRWKEKKSNSKANTTFHFYCNNYGRDEGRNENAFKKSQVTLNRLAVIFNVSFIYQYRV